MSDYVDYYDYHRQTNQHLRITMSNHASLPLLGHGFYWQELKVGQRMRTLRRTLTETDLVNFISVTGMLEAIFIDKTHLMRLHRLSPFRCQLAAARPAVGSVDMPITTQAAKGYVALV